MKNLISTLAALGLIFVVNGCSESEAPTAASSAEPAAAEEAPALPEVEVAAAKALFEAGSARPVDANSESTRTAEGVVPGAVLLSSGSYDLSELPADVETLIFYCSNTYCTASDRAAEKAREAGREVAVMRGGIMGWKEAGFETDTPS